MKTKSKESLLKENIELSRAVSVRDEYLMHAFRCEVTFIQKSSTRLGICGETRAHGGVVLEAARDNEDKWYVVGVYYWEEFALRAASYFPLHSDKEGQDRRAVIEQVRSHVNRKQGEFYSAATLASVMEAAQ